MAPLLATRGAASSRGFGLAALLAAGDYESIATVTVGSGGTSAVEFTSISTTGYKHLQIRAIIRLSSANTSRAFYCQVGNGSIDTGTNYSYHELKGDGSSASATAESSTTEMPIGRTTSAGASASVFGVFVIDILDYADTNKYKTIRSLVGYDNNGSGVASLTSGNWRSTSAINTIKIFGSGEDVVQYSHFALYGIKGVA